MSSVSWTQVYITGLHRSILPSDEEIEIALDLHYGLSSICDSCLLLTEKNVAKVDVEIKAEGSISRGWAGYGTTIIKRSLTKDSDGDCCCRGYAFLSFFTREAALIAIERINSEYYINNNYNNNNNNKHFSCNNDSDDGNLVASTNQLPKLRAEMVNASTTTAANETKQSLPDLRLKRQRKKPIGKHPVIISSNGRRTNLGNKTK
jgi:hypothetical protein